MFNNILSPIIPVQYRTYNIVVFMDIYIFIVHM